MGRFDFLDLRADVGPREARASRVQTSLGGLDFVRAGGEAYARGDVDAALRLYARGLGEDPLLEAAWTGQLFCLIDLGEYEEAAVWAVQGLGLLPTRPDLLSLRAVALGRMGRLTEARAALDDAAGIRRERALYWWARGEVHAGIDRRAAEHCFLKYLERSRNDWLAQLRVGRSYLTMEDPARARRHLAAARDLEPEAAIVWFTLGLACEFLGMQPDARRCLQRACDLNRSSREFARALHRVSNEGLLGPFLRGLAATFPSLRGTGNGGRKAA